MAFSLEVPGALLILLFAAAFLAGLVVAALVWGGFRLHRDATARGLPARRWVVGYVIASLLLAGVGALIVYALYERKARGRRPPGSGR